MYTIRSLIKDLFTTIRNTLIVAVRLNALFFYIFRMAVFWARRAAGSHCHRTSWDHPAVMRAHRSSVSAHQSIWARQRPHWVRQRPGLDRQFVSTRLQPYCARRWFTWFRQQFFLSRQRPTLPPHDRVYHTDSLSDRLAVIIVVSIALMPHCLAPTMSGVCLHTYVSCIKHGRNFANLEFDFHIRMWNTLTIQVTYTTLVYFRL